MKLTTLQWTMLLHYHAIAEPYAIRQPEHANSSAVIDQRHSLIAKDLLVRHDGDWPSGYKLTGKGRCLIEHICNDLPEPISITEWQMPN